MNETWRLFIAIEVPEAIRAHLTAVQRMLKRRIPADTVRWARPEGMHLTLRFLGDTPVQQREQLQQQLSLAADGHAPFRLSTATLGAFPTASRPRVVWVGVQGQLRELHALHAAVERSLLSAGYPAERETFHPHLTLGRVRPEATPQHVRQLGEIITATALEDHPAWAVSGITLFRSELAPGGSVYTALFHAPLAS